jgi:hypothetical protein
MSGVISKTYSKIELSNCDVIELCGSVQILISKLPQFNNLAKARKHDLRPEMLISNSL